MKKHFTIFFLVAITTMMYGCNEQQRQKENTESGNSSNEPGNQQQARIADTSLLKGDWTRTDAPYQIKISQLLEDGNMKVEYLNPKSIHVSKAEWRNTGGFIRIYVELRDENYPGSNYSLTYNPGKDLLAGDYYQAVERINYKVEFARTK